MRGLSAWFLIMPTLFLSACASVPTDLNRIVALPQPHASLCNNNESLDAFHRNWFCLPLSTANEPLAPVENLGVTKEAYRLIWLRSFHPEIIVRVEIESSLVARIKATSLETFHSEDEGQKVLFQQSATLSAKEIEFLRGKFYAASFWTLPHDFNVEMKFGQFSNPAKREEDVIMSDGAYWLVEGLSSDHYQIIGDGGIGLNSPPMNLGLVLLNLAHGKMPDLVIEPIY